MKNAVDQNNDDIKYTDQTSKAIYNVCIHEDNIKSDNDSDDQSDQNNDQNDDQNNYNNDQNDQEGQRRLRPDVICNQTHPQHLLIVPQINDNDDDDDDDGDLYGDNGDNEL